MSNYIEYNDKIAFHPGYYLKEIVEASGLTQADFARRMDTTPKNLSILLKGEQAISLDMAMKLSRMLGTSVEYWLNLQKNYEMLVAEFKLQEELQKELQKNSTEIAISKICKMIKLGYSKEDVLNLDYTNEEYALALERLSNIKY